MKDKTKMYITPFLVSISQPVTFSAKNQRRADQVTRAQKEAEQARLAREEAAQRAQETEAERIARETNEAWGQL